MLCDSVVLRAAGGICRPGQSVCRGDLSELVMITQDEGFYDTGRTVSVGEVNEVLLLSLCSVFTFVLPEMCVVLIMQVKCGACFALFVCYFDSSRILRGTEVFTVRKINGRPAFGCGENSEMQPPQPRSGEQSEAGSTLAVPLWRWERAEAWQPWHQRPPSTHRVRSQLLSVGAGLDGCRLRVRGRPGGVRGAPALPTASPPRVRVRGVGAGHAPVLSQ